MEDQQHFFSILNTVIIFLFVILLTWRKSRNKTNTSMLPPGPWKLLVIGNLHQMVGSMPHVRLTELAKRYGPIMHLQLGELSTFVISSPEIAKQLFTIHDLAFSERPFIRAASILFYGCKDIGFSKYGDYWRQVRKIGVLELLSAKRVQSFRSIREEKVGNLVKSIESSNGSPINLSAMLLSLSYRITLTTSFGKLGEQEDAFVPLARRMTDILGGFSIADLFPSSKLLFILSGMKGRVTRLHKEIDRLLESLIDKHKARRVSQGSALKNDKTDLVDVLLDLQDRGNLDFSLSNEHIKAIILDMFTAGTETSATILEWTMSELLRNPHIMKAAQREVREVYKGEESVNETKLQELKYLKLVIKEGMRLHTPNPLLPPRACREEVEINGYKIPSKSNLILNIQAFARDSKYWKEPERFIPERFTDSSIDFKRVSFEFLPFGVGRRMCPGIQFGTAVIELTLANLLYHFDWKLPDGMKGEDMDMSETFGLVVKRKNELYLIGTKYAN